jgi:hypothetical protein
MAGWTLHKVRLMARRQKRRSDGFLLNEPTARIAGGNQRESVRVMRGLPRVRLRELLCRSLLVHDLEPPAGASRRLSKKEIAQLRLIAWDGAMSNQLPPIRYNAILALAAYPSPQNLDLLEQLARFGEDFYVRSYAMLALGRCGILLGAPLLRDGLASKVPLERAAAARALRTMSCDRGPGFLKGLMVGERRFAVKESLRELEAASRRPVGAIKKRGTLRRKSITLPPRRRPPQIPGPTGDKPGPSSPDGRGTR